MLLFTTGFYSCLPLSCCYPVQSLCCYPVQSFYYDPGLSVHYQVKTEEPNYGPVRGKG